MQPIKRTPVHAWFLGLKEPTNCLTHFLGMVGAVFASRYLMQETSHNPWQFMWFSFYGASFVALYSASTFFHGLVLPRRQSRFLQRLDHAGIFLAIAGSNAPICMITLENRIGFLVMLIVTVTASVGITYTFARGRMQRKYLVPIYLAMSLPILMATPELASRLPLGAMFFLFGGGLVYIAAAAVFVLKKPNLNPPYFGFHEVFHVLIMIASALHFIFMVRYVLPQN